MFRLFSTLVLALTCILCQKAQGFPLSRQSGVTFITPTPEAMDASPSPEPEESVDPSPEADEEVCVDHRYLSSRFASHQLVHSTPIHANVLCPTSSVHSTLPCGTAHHMVRFNGNEMSYEQFCGQNDVTCKHDQMLVNSVLSHVWQDETHGDVQLTMYDNRHPKFIQRVIHRFISGQRALFH